MEENKNMEEVKPTYEELEQALRVRGNQINNLVAQIQELQSQTLITRLEFLFKVLDHTSSFDSAFVEKCAEEIKDLITIPENNEVEEGA